MIQKITEELRKMPKAVYVLAVIVVIGGLAILYRLYSGLGATTNLSKGYPWGIWISFDLSMVAFSGGHLRWPLLYISSKRRNSILQFFQPY